MRIDRLVSAVLCALPLGLLTMFAVSRRWLDDGGLVLARTAENLASGRGPVFNPGERVEVTVAPLWTALVACGHLVTGLDASTVAWSLGLLLGVCGLTLGVAGSWRLAATRDVLVLPLGLVVLAVVTPVSDYLTSGRETALAIGWLGAAYWCLTRTWVAAGERRPATPSALLLLSLGALIRPELVIVTVVFGAVLIGWPALRAPQALALPVALGWLTALPVVYQLFRMGYYGSLVPQVALATDAVSWHLGDAWPFVADFWGRYWLAVPVVAVIVAGPLLATRAGADPHRRALLLAPLVAGVGVGLPVLAFGTDSSHGRLWIPALVCLLLPGLVMGWPRAGRRAQVMSVALLMTTGWAAIAGTSLHPEFVNDPEGIRDARGFAISAGQFPRGDLSRAYLARMNGADGGRSAQRDKRAGDRYLRLSGGTREVPATDLVVFSGFVGTPAYAAPEVRYLDDVGLVDPIGARLSAPPHVQPFAGNLYLTPELWVEARFSTADPDAAIAAAQQALNCGEVADLRDAISQPMSIGRFLDNVVHATRYTLLEIPVDPVEAERRFCG